MIPGAQTKPQALSVYTRIGDRLEGYAGWVAALQLCLIFVIALGQASLKLLWYDELITLGTASLPHWRDVWNFYATGLDTSGPLPSLIVHAALRLPFGPEISSRLPFMLAFLLVCLCMYTFVHRCYPLGYALAAMTCPLTLFFFYYATEARSYAIMLAGAGFAMLCWQSAVSGRNRPWSVLGLWFGLALAIFSHAFAVFLFVPFALAQLVRDFLRRKPDWAVWTALALFPAGFLPVLNGDRLANKVYGSTFWCKPELRFLVMSYRDFFNLGWTFIAVLLFFAVGVVLLHRQRPLGSPEPETRGFSAPEWVLVAVLALMPFYALPVSYLFQVYRPCYVEFFNLGMVVLFIGAVGEVARRSRTAGAALWALIMLAAMYHSFDPFVKGLHALIHPGRVNAQLRASYDNQPWVKLLEKSSLPVVAGDPLLYTKLDFYAQPELKQRLYFLTDIADVKEYPRSATAQLNFLSFGNRLSYRTMDIANFLPANPHFLLAMGGDPAIWLPPYLLGQVETGNVSLRLLGPTYYTENVYDVQFMKVLFPVVSLPIEPHQRTY
jgi:hypothetical protein